MDFRAQSTQKSLAMGKRDGKAAVENGEGAMFDKIKEWVKSPQLQKQYPSWDDYLKAQFPPSPSAESIFQK